MRDERVTFVLITVFAAAMTVLFMLWAFQEVK